MARARRVSAALFVATLGVAVVTLIPSAPAFAQTRSRGENYAQTVLREVMRRHPQLIGMELAARRGATCVTVAATDAGDIGHRCDAGERELMRRREPEVEDPSLVDPAYVITDQLRDPSGNVIGLIMMDIRPERGGRSAALARARAIRVDVESRIRSAEQFRGGAP